MGGKQRKLDSLKQELDSLKQGLDSLKIDKVENVL